MKKLLFERSLTPSDFERVLFGSSPTRKSDQGWAPESISEGLFIDLSEVEFAEFTTLAQVALLVESGARHGISIRVALPFCSHRLGEQKFITSCRDSGDPAKLDWAHTTERAVRLRQNALQFMEHAGFVEALKVAHVPDAENLIKIEYDYDSGKVVSYDNADEPESSRPAAESKVEATGYFLKRIFRLRWFPPLSGTELSKSQSYATAILGLKDIGLSESDAMALAGTLLHELIENVHLYGGDSQKENKHPFALVGAVVLDPEAYHLRLDSFRPALREFVEWARETKSPVIRVIVGDSGAGIPQTLGPHFAVENEDEIPHLEPPLRPTEKMLFWSFHPWSTSDTKAALTKRGTRGLWRVQCLVRSYDGALTIRSEDAMVGWTYQSLNHARPIRERSLRFVPGTFVDICLLSRIQPHIKLPFKAIRDEDEGQRFAIVRCRGSETSSLSEEDLKQLIAELRKATPDKPKCVIAMLDVVPLSSRLTQEVFIDLLKAATSLTNHGALSLICPGVTWRQIEASVKSVDALMDTLSPSRLALLGVQPSDDPVLLLDAWGEGRWFGGDAVLRRLLTHLLAAPNSRMNEQAIREMVQSDDEVDALYRSLKNQPHLIQFTGDGVKLRFVPSDLSQYLISELGLRLRDSISHGNSKAVHKGFFRTPSLQCVNRWTDVHRLVDEVIGTGAAAFALARKLEMEAIKDETSSEISLVRVGMSNEFVGVVNDCLGLEKVRYSIPGELGAYDHPEVTRVPPGTRVIICTDIVLTENTVGHALTDLLRWNAEPLAVVCILDARANKTPTINCLGRDFPLVTLAEIDIVVDESDDSEDDAVNIDPVLREPLEHKSFRLPQYDISPDEVLALCRTVDRTLYFGHIERSIWRHFTTYLNAPRLIRNEASSREIIIDKFVQHIVAWVDDRAAEQMTFGHDASRAIEIWFPGSSDDFAGQIANAVKDELTEIDSDVAVVRLRGIPRVASAGRWTFPAEVKRLNSNAHIVIVDWGSITSVTVQQMIRLAADAGAASVKVIVFLSQMLIEDEMALRGIKAVNALQHPQSGIMLNTIAQEMLPFPLIPPEMSDNKPIQTQAIPVDVVFLSFLSQGYYQPRDCPICNLRKEYANEAQHCPTEFLRRHARETYDLLKEREREEVFVEEPCDLYKVPVSASEITNVVETRQQLQLALRSTHERKNVRNRLRGLVERGGSATKIGWLRLLATEPSWLKLPPLRFYELRDYVAQISIDIAREDSDETFQIGIRRQALIVLRAASKKRFIEELPNLLERCIDDKVLVQQLFHDTFTYLRRPYHQNSADAINRVWHSLTTCHDYLQTTGARLESGLEYLHTVSSLLRASEYLRSARITSLSSLEAWQALREHYLRPMEQHCEAIGCMMDVLMNMRSPALPEAIPDSDKWRIVLEEWQTCQMFLSANVFPYLKPLKELLLGRYYEMLTPVDDRRRLDRLIETGIPYEMDRVADLIFTFAQNPFGFLDEGKRDLGKREVEWWYNYFLNAGAEPKRSASKGATLLEFLRRCPCDFKEAVQFAVEDMKNQGFVFSEKIENPQELEAKVFCDRELLRNTLKHLIENAAGEKHADRPMGKAPRIKFMPIKLNESKEIRLVVLNDGTKPTRRGKGLDALDSSLRTFDGHVEGATFNDDGWSYKAELTLGRW